MQSVSEPTLAMLEDQEPQDQEDLESELHNISDALGMVRLLMRTTRSEEKKLMARRGWVRAQLRLLQTPIEHFTVRAEEVQETTHSVFNGTTEPSYPDAVEGEL